MRRFAVLALALACASCAYPPWGRPSTLLLGNARPEHVAVETVVTANPDCNARAPGYVAADRFSLPPAGTRFVPVPPGASVCWRVVPTKEGVAAPEWNRTYLAPGRLVDSRI